MIEDPARAYAVLGLRQGSSLSEVRRRYRFLAQCWHPDRHAGDSASQAEATDAMCRINGAYRCLVDYLGSSPEGGAEPNGPRFPEHRLSRGAVECIVMAIGSDGPLDWLMDGLSWVGRALGGLLVALLTAGSAIRLAVLTWRGDLGAVLQDHGLLVSLGILLAFLLHELLGRRRLVRAAAAALELRRNALGATDLPIPGGVGSVTTGGVLRAGKT